jgi:hypothetical protein
MRLACKTRDTRKLGRRGLPLADPRHALLFLTAQQTIDSDPKGFASRRVRELTDTTGFFFWSFC